jgi:hypothetical protein
MNGPGGAPASGVPTLTEVVAWPAPAAVAPAPLEPAPEAFPLEANVLPPATPPVATVMPLEPAAAPVAPATLPTEEQLTQRVLNDLQHQIELMLDYRMREILTPILTRATDSVIRDARAELASTLRDLVARAVAQELARHRDK